ncbi:MAG: NAD(P)H-dependent glycerol-3-phosphate dehydrogenase [Gemmataceae bacterium]
MPMTFTVLGDGAWGTALALLLASQPENRVRLWSAREETGQVLARHRENVLFLPGIPIPESVLLTTSIPEATAAADFWISAIPTVYLRPTLTRIREELRGATIPPIVSLTKGIEIETFQRPSEILTEVLGASQVAVLSGPSHAEEVSRGLPCSVVVAAPELRLALEVQRFFRTDTFRVYTNLDPLGVELAGALKNVIGLAAGTCEGLGYGDNALSALITRGLAEMTRFGVALGADSGTFVGLAGIGDLITTCISKHGRNRNVGYRLARGEKLADVLSTTQTVAEGVTTTRAVYARSLRMGLDMPITRALHRVLYEGLGPREAVTELMLRSPKGEKWPS